jgi:pantoate--beta-alanine ligase
VEVVRTRAALRATLREATRPVGLVPTMGALHAGHVSLVRRARAESATVVLTIFVNPRQFGDAGDLAAYPRDEAADLATCAAEGVDVVFIPPVEEIYPPGFDTLVRVGAIAEPLEGAARPGHFEGVATVVAILLGLAGADRAYLGAKDAQQLAVIRRMVADLAMSTEIVSCPTVRETDGLAMSSRNARLTPMERAAAPVVRASLMAARQAWAGGERSAEALRERMRETLAGEPLVDPEYVSVADPATLAELDLVDDGALLSLAVRLGAVRLIDSETIG